MNNNNNRKDNVHRAVMMTQPLRQLIHLMTAEQHQADANSHQTSQPTWVGVLL